MCVILKMKNVLLSPLHIKLGLDQWKTLSMPWTKKVRENMHMTDLRLWERLDDQWNLLANAFFTVFKGPLLLDGHSSHLKFAKKNGIIVFYFPVHYSHHVQPLDLRFFRPLHVYVFWLRNTNVAALKPGKGSNSKNCWSS